jgi:hypothetical protein
MKGDLVCNHLQDKRARSKALLNVSSTATVSADCQSQKAPVAARAEPEPKLMRNLSSLVKTSQARDMHINFIPHTYLQSCQPCQDIVVPSKQPVPTVKSAGCSSNFTSLFDLP